MKKDEVNEVCSPGEKFNRWLENVSKKYETIERRDAGLGGRVRTPKQGESAQMTDFIEGALGFNFQDFLVWSHGNGRDYCIKNGFTPGRDIKSILPFLKEYDRVIVARWDEKIDANGDLVGYQEIALAWRFGGIQIEWIRQNPPGQGYFYGWCHMYWKDITVFIIRDTIKYPFYGFRDMMSGIPRYSEYPDCPDGW
jgi:hypothetical protein